MSNLHIEEGPGREFYSMCDVQRLIYVDTDVSCMYIDRRGVTVNE